MNKTDRINLRAKTALNKLPRLNPLERNIRLLSVAPEINRWGILPPEEALKDNQELDRKMWSL